MAGRNTDRRSFLKFGAYGAAGVAGASWLASCTPGTPGMPTTTLPAPGTPVDPVFDCGVASGLHTPTAQVLWTRVAPGATSSVPTAWEVATDPGFRLVPVPQAAVSQMRAQYPFLEPQVIAARTYDGLDLPTETLGIPILLTCRADLDEELVRALTVVLFRELPALQQRVTAAAAIDVDLAPTAPLPLHPGAARFYREREIEQ